jgi:hypothetical protein
MKILLIGAAIGATLIGALPAAAQVTVRAGSDGVVIRQHTDRGHHYGYRNRHHGWRRHHASCKTVTVKTRRANGTVVVRKRTVC